MADQDDVAAALVMDLGLAMHLGDQRAGGVDGEEPPPGAACGTDFGTPWAEKITGAAVVRDLVELATKTAPFAFRLSTTYLLCTISCRT